MSEALISPISQLYHINAVCTIPTAVALCYAVHGGTFFIEFRYCHARWSVAVHKKAWKKFSKFSFSATKGKKKDQK